MRSRMIALAMAFGAIIIAGCSKSQDAENRYALLKQYQEASETLVNTSHDYELRISTCGQVIDSLEAFLTTYGKSELASVAAVECDTWKARQAQLQNKYDKLMENVSAETLAAARKAAQGRHDLSDIEEISRTTRTTEKRGSDLIVNDEYAVRMRGRFLGKDVFSLKIFVKGIIDLSSGAVSTDSDVKVTE